MTICRSGMSKASSINRIARPRIRRKALSWGFGLLAISTALNAQSISWHFVVRSDDIAFYAEPKSLVIHDTMRTMRLLYDYAQTQQNPDTLEQNLSTIELASI